MASESCVIAEGAGAGVAADGPKGCCGVGMDMGMVPER